MINSTVKKILQNYSDEQLLSYKGDRQMPDRDSIIDIIDDVKNIIFPGYFHSENIAGDFSEYYTGQQVAHVYNSLKKQIKKAFSYKNESQLTYEQIREKEQEISSHFISQLPNVQKILLTDVQAGFDGDPAAHSKEDIILSYPGLFATFVYRIAHVLYTCKVPYIPRMMTEYAHSLTGIDINSGASIGEYFFIDHGTGIVIGETCVIGNNVKLYQGVTLGALSTRSGQQLAGVKRHPTIENNVTIYSGASILGGETIIGEESIIGGNCFVTASVPPRTKVTLKEPELIFKGPKNTNPGNWEI
ncbi:MAG: serine acetyltransferase [Clostridia bacterium]|nr:serine acetyltransferase [Clostridia bacterium]